MGPLSRLGRRETSPAGGGGFGRPSTAAAREVSRTMRLGADRLTRARRAVAAADLAAVAALIPVAAYQCGLMRHLPEPRWRWLDADRVDASGEAFVALHTADAALGIASYAMTLALAATGSADRAWRRPWLVLAFGAKVLLDAGGAAMLTAEQVSRHRRLCSYCLAASLCSSVAVPVVVREAPVAARAVRDGRR